MKRPVDQPEAIRQVLAAARYVASAKPWHNKTTCPGSGCTYCWLIRAVKDLDELQTRDELQAALQKRAEVAEENLSKAVSAIGAIRYVLDELEKQG